MQLGGIRWLTVTTTLCVEGVWAALAAQQLARNLTGGCRAQQLVCERQVRGAGSSALQYRGGGAPQPLSLPSRSTCSVARIPFMPVFMFNGILVLKGHHGSAQLETRLPGVRPAAWSNEGATPRAPIAGGP